MIIIFSFYKEKYIKTYRNKTNNHEIP